MEKELYSDDILDRKQEILEMCIRDRCEDALKEEIGVTSRCMPFEQEHLSGTCVHCGKPAKQMVYWGKAY